MTTVLNSIHINQLFNIALEPTAQPELEVPVATWPAFKITRTVEGTYPCRRIGSYTATRTHERISRGRINNSPPDGNTLLRIAQDIEEASKHSPESIAAAAVAFAEEHRLVGHDVTTLTDTVTMLNARSAGCPRFNLLNQMAYFTPTPRDES